MVGLDLCFLALILGFYQIKVGNPYLTNHLNLLIFDLLMAGMDYYLALHLREMYQN